ncbi:MULTISPECIES: universal stress protein [unclassified Mycobacterium]|uniref:universal stress protein n=1 Tax=unclassified Mycobacterium TaxID=2642494 RepID=UPI0008017044|nr:MULTISPECIES: universal stress protein [unclassified Mycobacterium]OBG60468.1 universal stress protein UspA [Mycobacterium sp. E188]OBG81383.1 universal stress protein UspA [Mycobacterium sp. E3305]OBG93060.1 universal stress protein UspA [Mycobacterium sp. E3298]OBH14065.1 universal stress protein UspA [Mycobacterium sp. E1715]OBH40030.1 universal stress protein UspA [Mycobacterium sp. E183]
MSAPDQQRGIVVAVDGSTASNAAARWAAREAAMRKVPLTVVHAVTTPTATWPPVPYPDSLAVRLEDEGKKAIMHAIKLAEEALAADREIAINRELVYSSPALALIKMSDEAEMVVVGTAGRGLLARGVLGSVSATVVRHANCPVAVIHGDDLPDNGDAPVLVGIDGSPASELATAVAFDEASRRGVDLMALHAWSDIAISELPEADWSSLEEEAQRSLAENLAGWQERYPDVTVQRLVERDAPARQLAEKSEFAQLLVVGSHGRGGLSGILLGSVSNAVLHSVRIPVIVARPSASG